MIPLTRLNGTKYYLNADMIMSVEGTPDTVITLLNTSKFIVKDKPEEVIDRIMKYQRSIHIRDVEIIRGV